jgi:hypothetical protein
VETSYLKKTTWYDGTFIGMSKVEIAREKVRGAAKQGYLHIATKF